MSGENTEAGQDAPVVASEATPPEPAQDNKAGTPSTDAQAVDSGDDTENEQPKYTEKEYKEALARETAKAAAKAERKAFREAKAQLEKAAPPMEQSAEAGEQPAKSRVTQADVEAYLAQQSKEKAFESFVEKAEAASEKYPDFMEAVSDPRLPFTDEMVEFFAESAIGDELAYHLAKNKAKAFEIANMPLLKAGRELAKLEQQLTAEPPKPKVSSAPQPINAVRKPSAAAKTYDTTDPRAAKELSTSEWIKAEEARMRRKYAGQT